MPMALPCVLQHHLTQDCRGFDRKAYMSGAVWWTMCTRRRYGRAIGEVDSLPTRSAAQQVSLRGPSRVLELRGGVPRPRW